MVSRRIPLARTSSLVRWALAGLVATGCGPGESVPEDAPAHSGIPCSSCHSGPDVGGLLAGTPDRACVSCHDSGSLSERVAFHTGQLSHDVHGEHVGPSLGCASCHDHDEGPAPLRVETEACLLCHSERSSHMASADQACATCHPAPADPPEEQLGIPIRHADLDAAGIRCSSCHWAVVEILPRVTPERCRECHESRGTLQTMEAAEVHAAHPTAEVGLSCRRCHEPPSHGMGELTRSFGVSCIACHPDPQAELAGAPHPDVEAGGCEACHGHVHAPQRAVYAGLAARGVSPMPDVMFRAGIPCLGCHQPSSRGTASVPGDDDCAACHGRAFRGMEGRWVRESRRRVAEMDRVLAAFRVGGEASALVDSLVLAARANVELVRDGQGSHNPAFAAEVLRTAALQMERAASESGGTAARPHLGFTLSEEPCLRCHFGIENVAVRYGGLTMPHAAHVVDGEQRCVLCHSDLPYRGEDGRPNPDHGGMVLSGSQDCAACHHLMRQGACDSCHGPEDVGDHWTEARLVVEGDDPSTREEWSVRFRHGPHNLFGCGTCHSGASLGASQAVCVNCHGPHHQSGADCLACHEPPPQGLHPAKLAHGGCGGCHPRAATLDLASGRHVCLLCHESRVDHHPDQECASCHLVGQAGG